MNHSNNTITTITTFIPIVRDTLYSFFSTWKPKSFVGLSIDLSSILSRLQWVIQFAVILDSIYRVFTILKVLIYLDSSLDNLSNPHQREYVFSNSITKYKQSSFDITLSNDYVDSTSHYNYSHYNSHHVNTQSKLDQQNHCHNNRGSLICPSLPVLCNRMCRFRSGNVLNEKRILTSIQLHNYARRQRCCDSTLFEIIQNRGKKGTAKKRQIIAITWKMRQFKHMSN